MILSSPSIDFIFKKATEKPSKVLACLLFGLVFNHANANPPVIEQRGLTQASGNPQGSAAWQLYEKIQSFEAEIQQLRNKVELLETQVARQEENNDRLILNIESRIDNLENGLVDVMNTTEGQPSSTNKNANSSANPLSEREEIKAKETYLNAYKIFKSEGASAGVTAMSQFINDFSGSELIPSAHYWLGDFYLKENVPNTELAALNFSTVINTYPTSEKAPTSLYRLASIANNSGNVTKAKRYAQKIVDDYPKSKEAEQVKGFLKK